MVAGGVLLWRQRKALSGLGGGLGRFVPGRVPQAALRESFNDGTMKTELRTDRNMPIEQRVASIQDLVHKSVQDPKMRKLALAITSKCPERDGMCEAKAIYQAVKSRVRYTGDIAPIKQGSRGPVEGIDLYQSAWRTWEFQGGDCDDQSILVATLLALNGIEPRLRVTAESKSADWGHIYPGAILPKNSTGNGKFVTLDTTLPGNNRFGVEIPFGKNLDFPA
jgi:transglutaminase-like putative cysteine protease